MKIDSLANATGLRCFATIEEMATAASDLVTEALSLDLTPHGIDIACSSDFDTSGEYHIILWAD